MTIADHIVEPRFAQPEERTYSSADLMRITGATYRQLDWWCSHKALIPHASPGSGKQRHFTAADLDAVYAAVALTRFGMTVDAALSVARQLVANDHYEVQLGEVFELSIRVRDTTSDPVEKPEPPSPEGGSA